MPCSSQRHRKRAERHREALAPWTTAWCYTSGYSTWPSTMRRRTVEMIWGIKKRENCLEIISRWRDGVKEKRQKGNGGKYEWYWCGSPSWWLWEATKTHEMRMMCVNSSLHGPQIQFILSFLIGTVITASSFTHTPAERYASQLLPWLLQGGTHLLNTPQKQPCASFINQKWSVKE